MNPGKGEPSISSKPNRFKVRLPLRLVLKLQSIIAAALAWPLSRLSKSNADAFNTMATQLKENLASLHESEERFRTLVEQAPEAILVRDVDTGLFVDANRNAEKLLGCSREEILKSGPERFYPESQPDNRPLSESMQEYTIRALAGQTVTFERTVRNTAGREIMCQVWLIRLPSMNRRLIRGSFIDITERKEAEMKLQASKEYAENLIQTANAMIIGLDTSGNITLFNKAAEKITGYTQAELSGKNWFEILVPKDRYPFVWDEFNRLPSGGLSRNFENPILTRNGEERYIVWQNDEVHEHGKIVGSISFGIDITERKRTEERLAKLNECFLGFGIDPIGNINRLTALCGELMGATCALYNRLDKGMLCSWGQWNAPPGYNPVDKPQGHICYDTIYGGSDEVLVVRNLPETLYALTDPNVAAYNLKTYVGRAIRLGEDYVGSLCVVYQNDFSPGEDDKRFMGVIASAIAVEERRRRSEKSFMESEKRFRSIVESANDAVILANGNGKIIMWNKGAQAIFGYTEEEMIGKPASFMIPERYRKKVELVMSTGKSDFFGKTVESFGYRKDGSEFPLEISIATWTIEKEAYYSVIIRDITGRKLAEKKLREASLYSRSLIEVNLDPLVTINLEGKIADVNKAGELVTGVPRDKLIGSDFPSYVTEPEKAMEGYHLVLSQGLIKDYPLTLRHISGKVTEVLFNASVYKNEAGEVQGVFAAARDITERKQLEDKLSKTLEQMSLIIESLPVASYICKTEGDFGTIYVSDNIAAFTGYKPEDFTSNSAFWSENIHPDDKPGVFADIPKLFEKGHHEHEYRWRIADGSYIWVYDYLRLIRLPDGSISHIVGMWQDITERKRAQEQIELLKHSVDIHYDGAYWMDTDNKLVYVNDAGCKALGYRHEELIGKSVTDINPRATPERMKSVWEKLRKEGFFSAESVHRRKDGSEFPVEIISTYVQFGGKEYNCGFAHDITERKRAEEALRENEMRYRTLFNRAGDYVMVLEMGQDGTLLIQDMNEAALKAHGYSREEIQGRPLSIIDPESSPEKNKERGSRLGHEGSLLLNVHHRRKDGSMFDVEASTQMVRIGGKRLIISVERDITERKRAVGELKRSKEFSETILNSMNHEISIIDIRDFRIIDVNQVVLDRLKIEKKDLIGKKCFEIIHKQGIPCTFPDNICPVAETTRTGKFSMAEHIHYNRDGTKEYVEVSTSPIKNENGEVIQVVHIAKDITERKRAEEKIMASLKEKEILLREIHHRVKNNMQIISSLLRLQSENVKNEEYLEIFKDSYNRIRTMSLVHEKLYQSRDFTNINFKDYIHDLVGSIYQSHFIDKNVIKLNMNIETVSLGIDIAIPCGLIINELVTNSLKYAFPQGRNGEIGIILFRIGENRFELVVSDNGISIPQNIDFRKTETLGLRLVSMLAEDQLLGEISLDRSKGTEFKIRFRS
ncbi:MAG: PAS domain S-box protein [Candidatus Methanoperedens sp.]|nr:PAS domain S-box protein [Candidatus Methanoperedens sp.]